MSNAENKLKGFDKKMLREAKKPKNVLKWIKIYNNMCNKCKQMALANTRRPIEDYCDDCQQMMEKIYEK